MPGIFSHFYVPSEDWAFRYLVKLKYDDEPVCPRCGGSDPRLRTARRKLICRHCLHEWSPLQGTLFQGSHLPLHTWLSLIWDLLHIKGPITAKRMADRWDMGSYRTAWFVLARIRVAMARENLEVMAGVIEMDDHIIRGISSEYHKTVILGALKFGIRLRNRLIPAPQMQLKLKIIVDPDEMRLKNFLDTQVSKHSRIYADDRKLYLRSWLGLNNFTVLSSQERGHPFQIRGILQDIEEHLRVDHGGVGDKYLQSYLDEAVFYFHHLDDEDKGFQALVKCCLDTPSLKREDLVHPTEHLSIIESIWRGWAKPQLKKRTPVNRGPGERNKGI